MAEYTHPLDQLLELGAPRGTNVDWLDCAALGIGPEHIPDLIRMATDMDLNWADSDSLEVYAPVHAWRALGILRAEEAVEPLLNLFHELEDSDWVGEELPEVYGRIGPAAVPALKTYLADTSHSVYPRVSAAHSLECIGRLHPEVRDTCVQVLMEQLEGFRKNSRLLNGFLISYLMDLEAVEAAPLMERAFIACRVDTSIGGDWEDVQMELGLKRYRESPPEYAEPFYQPEPGNLSQAELGRINAAKRTKAKTKRKMEKASRRKNRKRKK